MPFETICAVLVGSPWRLSLEQIGQLTDWQIAHIYFHPRNDKGEILIPGQLEGTAATAQRAMEAFEENCRFMGLSPEETAAKWEKLMDQVAQQGEGKPTSAPPRPPQQQYLGGFNNASTAGP